MSSNTKVYALVFSDLHLGSRQSTVTVEIISGLIRKLNPPVVVFAGDTVDLFASKNNLRYLDELKGIPGRKIFLSGNHDPIETFEESVIFDVNGKKIKIFHGHNEEPFYGRCFDWPATKINEFLLRIIKFNLQNRARSFWAEEHDGKKYVPYLYAEMKNIVEKQITKIVDEYKNGYFDIVITGHTHYTERWEVGRYLYINMGDWNHYAIIYDSGDIALYRI
jgi:predicted phosphodiesterase